MSTIDLRQKRANLWEEAKSLHKLAELEKRELTAEEREQWDRINGDIDHLKLRIDREERIAALDSEMDETDEPVAVRQPEIRKIQGGGQDMGDDEQSLPASKEYKRAFGEYLRRGLGGMRPESRALIGPYYGSYEKRVVGTTSDAVGGALISEEFYRQMVEAMQAYGGMRLARTTKLVTATGADMPIPLVDDTHNMGGILAEGSAVNTDGEDPEFGSVTLGAYLYTSKLVRVGVQLLQDAAFNFEAWLAQALGRRLGRITNYHFTQGSGTNQPQGIVTGATAGVTDAALAVDYADLLALEHSIDPVYRSNGAQWMFHDTTLALLKQIEDGDGRLVWLPGLAVNAPDTILGYNYIINQQMPQAEGEAKAILFGDFSHYFIRDVQDIRVLRLEERFAEYLQVGFLAFMRSDGVFASPTAISGSSEQTANESAPVKYLQFEAESS